MIVYVESNFVLEVVLDQEQAAAASELIHLAEQNRARLAIPAFAVVEPLWTLHRMWSERDSLWDKLVADLRQVKRSAGRRAFADSLLLGIETLRTASDEQMDAYQSLVARLTAAAEIIPLNDSILRMIAAIQSRYELDRLDTVVLASILHHLATDDKVTDFSVDKVFVTRDRAAFSGDDVRKELNGLGCRPMFSFVALLQELANTHPKPPDK